MIPQENVPAVPQKPDSAEPKVDPDATVNQPVVQSPPVDSEAVASVPPTLQPVAESTPATPISVPAVMNRFVRPEFINSLSDWLFRLGFSSIFLVNSIYAALHPGDFTALLNGNLIARLIGHADLMIKIVMVNDLLIGVFLLMGRYKKIVYIWAGAWLLLVAGLKLMNLIF